MIRRLGGRVTGGAVLGAVVGVLAATGGCRGDDIYFDCEYQETAFRADAAREGALLDPIPNGGPYPVAIKFSEVGVNKLLDGVVGQDVPFTGQLPFVWYTGPATLFFEATSAPVIELESLEGCATCVQYSFDFDAQMFGPNGDPQGAGIGSVKFRVPIELEANGDASTVLYADYSRLRVQELYLSAFGLETEEHPALVEALGLFMQEKIQLEYGKTPLLTLDSWEIGTNDVRLLARKLIVFPEQDTLVLAMQSNLPLPPGGGLEISGEMPMGIPMLVDFDVAMFESMVERLMDEGTIPRIYDEDGKVDEDGSYGVTLDHIVGGSEGQDFMTTQFKVWRFADGYCGYAVATMDLAVDLGEDEGVVLTAGDVAVLGGQGAGAVAARESELVEDNQDVVKNFRKGVVDNLGTTINYDALGIEGSSIVFNTLAVDLDVNHLETWIDFFVVEAPETPDP
ncbi:hypothetical protein DB30_03558 [Enhygromyxa salina]|uniref:Uncharacterized protein n=1 Tax=Enhygromyxa salina TaxID=215803 RepID=A0A0C2D6I9_9BACT|nr:hypothetical protein [Enhygromyxa salina]KIG17245.1 hypothetical protein DB30_03558 [Enhygromyxa salina]